MDCQTAAPPNALPTFLPGRLSLDRGTTADYHALARFHYAAGPPATWAAIWTIRYTPHRALWSRLQPPSQTKLCTTSESPAAASSRPVAIAVLSYPTLNLTIRERVLRLERLDRRQRTRFVNEHIRCISRVIVHPQFRSLGLAVSLVRHLLHSCPTRYLEAVARMARASPFFDRAGLTRHDPPDPDGPVYYLYDKRPSR